MLLEATARASVRPVQFFDLPTLKVPTKLRNVTFDVTSWCNLMCIGCSRTRAVNEGKWVDGHMTKETFQKIIDNLPPMAVAILQGVGEPTLNPEFLDICRIAHASGKTDSINFHTNGITRDAEYYVEVAKYVDNITVSVDSLNKFYTDQVRQGTKLEKLVRCLKGLSDKGIRVSINMVVSRTNILDVVSTLGILNSIGPYNVNLQQFMGPEHGVMSKEDNDRLHKAIEQLLPYIPNINFPFLQFGNPTPPPAAEIVAPTPIDIIVTEPAVEAPACPSTGQTICNMGAPALSPFITRDGFITPCCLSEDPSKFGYSNLTERSFAEIWESDVVRRYMHRFIEKSDFICDGCYNRQRDLLSTDDGPADVTEAVEKVLHPAVDFANMLGDFEQAARFQSQFRSAFAALDNKQR